MAWRKRQTYIVLLSVALLGLFGAACGGSAEPTPTPTPTVVPVVTPTSSPGTVPVATPPNIPHTLKGRDNCLTCHVVGAGGVGQPGGAGMPQDHEGRTINICQSCHGAQ